MRALLVTSAITFCPANYDAVVCGLARCPRIGGLLVLDNTSPVLFAKALGAIAMGARRTGAQLLRNLAGGSAARRLRAYADAGKEVWRLPTINSDEARGLIAREGFDLVVNARTRFIYGKKSLAVPRLGCVNVHHGLLPEQRGTMCDLWALHERRPAGFSLHAMTARVDDGPLLARVEVAPPGAFVGYLDYLRASARVEVDAIGAALERVAAAGRVEGEPNRAPDGLLHRKNPTAREIRAMRAGGLLL